MPRPSLGLLLVLGFDLRARADRVLAFAPPPRAAARTALGAKSWASRLLDELKNELQEELDMSNPDGSIGELPVMYAPDDAVGDGDYGFDFDGWASHRSPARYFRLLIGILFGNTTRRVIPVVTLLGGFSALTSYYNIRACTTGDDPGLVLASVQLPQLELPIIPFEVRQSTACVRVRGMCVRPATCAVLREATVAYLSCK